MRIASELKASELPAPLFVSEPFRFKLSFHRNVILEANKKDNSYSSHLTPRQLLAIKYVEDHGTISNAELQEIAGISKRTATRELNVLKTEGIFLAEGVVGRGTVYKLRK